MSTAAIDMERAAELTGYSYERFRKVWSRLPGFPRPFKQPVHGKGPYAWVEDHVLEWREARARSVAVAHAPPPVANDAAEERRMVHRAHDAAVNRQRGELARMMGRG